MNRSRYIRVLTSADLATVIFLNLLSILCVIFSSRISSWMLLIVVNTILTFLIFIIANVGSSSPSWLKFVRDWYPVPMVLFVFKETYLMVHPIHPTDYDAVFASIDHWMFGVYPTRWMASFSFPLLTEILQICYASYYFILVSVFVELYSKKKYEEFFTGAFLLVYGFYISYAGYFAFPGVGPRFFLHNFQNLNKDLPGIFLTNFLRDFVNAGESIPRGVSNAMDFAQRDIFPSGHTQLTLVALYIAFKNKIRIRWILVPFAVLLIVATVYLRYHYVIDVIAGGGAFLFTIWSGLKIDTWWKKFRIRTS
jgi:membrane-associated phospholipid phosphatase